MDKNEPVKSPGSLLADSLYNPVEPPSDPPVEEPTNPPADLAADPEPSDPPEGSVEVSEGSEVEEVELQSLEELAEHFELDQDWLTKLAITRKVNGKPVKVSISEALDSLDKVKAADDYLADADKRRNEILTEATQKQEQLTTTIATFAKLLESVESEIDSDVKAIDWTKLREDDPAEYAAKKDEVRERKSRLDAMKQEAREAVSKSMSQHQQQTEEAIWEDRKMRFQTEKEALLRELPEWEEDSEKATAEQQEAVAYMKKLGASENQIMDTLYRGIALATIVKAMRYDKAKTKASAARKKVVRVTKKVLKPGASRDAPKPNGKDDPVTILYG